MKYIYKIVLLSFIIIGISSCDENENFEILAPQGGIAINSPIDGAAISIDKTNLENPGLTISWTSSTIEGTGATYTVEAALIGTNFAEPFLIGTTDATSINLSVEELNTFALDVLGIPGDSEAGIDIRVYANDVISQSVSILLTPFSIVYEELFLVGSLTGWDAAQGLPFENIGVNEFEITINLADGDAFKFVPQNDSGWDGAWKEDPNNPGILIDEEGDPNISGYPAGNYKIYVNLNTLTFTVTEILVTPPTNLYLVGDATAAGWGENNNNYPMFKDANNEGVFIYTGYFIAGEIKLLEIGDWHPQWGKGGNDGELAGSPATQENDPNPIIVDTDGYYTLQVDFNTLSYTLETYDVSGATEYTTIGVIGDATNSADLDNDGTPDGWQSDVDMTQSTFDSHIWFLNGITLEDGEIKFRADNGWDVNWGNNGNNISVSAGNYNIWFNDLTGSYILIPVIEDILPVNLYLVGGATAADWSNNNNNTPMFRSSEDNNLFTITGKFLADGFKFLEIKGQWAPQWGTNGGGTLVYRPTEADPDPGTLNIDSEGYYTVNVNLNTEIYTITPYDVSGATEYATIGIIGDATNSADLDNNGTPDGWESDVDMTQSTFDPHIWYINDITLEDGEIKFRADNDWGVSWGDNGSNISVSAGSYNIWFNDLTGEYHLIPILT